MPIPIGVHKLGPDNAKLLVRTKKGGAASMAGHNLLIEVQSWSATLEIAQDGHPLTIELSADSGSLKVIEGTGGVQSLDDDDRAGIAQTIDEEVLRRTPIEFRSTDVEPLAGGEQLNVRGELELAGRSHPVAFELHLDGDGRLTGSAIVKQSDWGMKPYTALFGTLKVLDEVTVEVVGKP